jgi:uncharacterized protein (DUF1697 family)
VPQRPLADRVAKETGGPCRHLLQSGNLVVAAPPDGLADLVAGLIREQTGLEIPVIVRTAELAELLALCPWPGVDARRVHLSMWDADHDPDKAAAMTAADWSGDEIVFAGRNAWMLYASSFHEAKLGNHVVERRRKVVATARNRDTITAVVDLVRTLAASAEA